MKKYKIIRIDEPDFGCEGRPEGEPMMDTVHLIDEESNEMLILAEDSLLYEQNLNEGDRIMLDADNQMHKIESCVRSFG